MKQKQINEITPVVREISNNIDCKIDRKLEIAKFLKELNFIIETWQEKQNNIILKYATDEDGKVNVNSQDNPVVLPNNQESAKNDIESNLNTEIELKEFTKFSKEEVEESGINAEKLSKILELINE